MAIRGQRFHINLSSDEETDAPKSSRPTSTAGPGIGLLGDIKERSVARDGKPPSPPRITKNDADTTGFPAHRKRSRPSAFNRRRAAQLSNGQDESFSAVAKPNSSTVRAVGDHGASYRPTKKDSEPGKEDEAQSIDEENTRRIANMSPEEIEEARTELLTGLSSSLIERLLKNANIDDDAVDLIDTPEPDRRAKGNNNAHPGNQSKKVAFHLPDAVPPSSTTIAHASSTTERSLLAGSDLPPANLPPDLHPASVTPPPRQKRDTALPAPPSLDPSSPSFFTDLHETYFPSLPANPSAMAWMMSSPPPASSASASASASESDYSSSRTSLAPSSLRFDFRGHLLPPRLAAQIPATKGLHHHSVAPDAAGYTIPELARLAHSAVAAQRCIAHQTLGRLLYRLGRGDFGPEGDELCESLWAMIQAGDVLDGLIREAGRGGEAGNRTCWVTATEAVWWWRKGGGKRWKAE